MNRDDIIFYLKELNNILAQQDIYGDIYIYGGSALCLTTDFRSTTQDIDAIFQHKLDIYDAADVIARKFNLVEDWLNDGVKGFLSKNNTVEPFLALSNLKIQVASLEYIFAMKVLSARTDLERDKVDLLNLAKLLNIRDFNSAVNLVNKYYSFDRLHIKSQYFLQEVLDQL